MTRSSIALITTAVAVALSGCAGSAPAPAPDVRPVAIAPADSAPPAAGDGLAPAFHEAFGVADRRARAVAYWLQCVPSIARLRAEGAFGPAARAPRGLHCERTADGVPIGMAYDVDSAFTTMRRVQAVRLDSRAKYTEPLDTARLLKVLKLARDVSARVTPAWAQRKRPFSVIPFAPPEGPLEGWVIPRATKARSIVTGGDIGFAASAAAPTIIEDRTTTWTQLNLAPTGPVRIYSSTREIPAVSDLASARYYAELGRPVTVSTPLAISTLVEGLDEATGSRYRWKHSRSN